MKKNRTVKTILILCLLLAMSPLNTLAAVQVIEKTGSIFAGDPYFNTEKNSYTVDFIGTEVAVIVLQSWTDGFGQMQIEKRVAAADDGYTYMVGNNFTCNSSYQAFYYNAANQQVGSLKLVITDLVDPICDSSGAGETPPACDSCAVFDCPGWDEYMAKLDGIKAAIPPPPDWNQIAGTFRDTIAPRIKEDMRDLLGTAPTPPAAPSPPVYPDTTAPEAPTPPPALGGVDDGGRTAPTGQEAPGLGDAGFTAGDIQSEAPVIQEREDPTGGFSIMDPMGSLPTQEEFKQNAPKPTIEPSPAPEAPGTGDPSTLPLPPGSGSGDFNTAPLPPGSGSTGSTAPIPGGSGSTGSTAPLPPGSGGSDFGIPIPGESNENTP